MVNFILFILSMMAFFTGWLASGIMLFLIILFRWDMDDMEIACKLMKEAEERELNKEIAFQEIKHKEAEEAFLEDEYSSIGYGRFNKENLVRRLAFHDRTGHATKKEKELLEILAAKGYKA